MRHLPYIGSGPYCYANSFAMMFGEHALHGRHRIRHGQSVRHADARGALPLFDPHGWNPDAGFDGALAALGWRSDRSCGGSAGEALERLHDALAHGPAWIGPVEMGYFRHQPGMTGPIQADHYVVALAIEDGCVLMHDPQGFPMPRCRWPTSWPPGRRTPWTTARPTPCARASRASRRSRNRGHPRRAAGRALARHGSATARSRRHAGQRRRRRSAGEQAARRLRRRAPDASDPFRGPRRRVAPATRRPGPRRLPAAAAVAAEQARYIGALQHPLVTRRDASAAQCLRRLAPTYSRLLAALRAES